MNDYRKAIKLYQVQRSRTGGRIYEEMILETLKNDKEFAPETVKVGKLWPFQKGLRVYQLLELILKSFNNQEDAIHIRSFIPVIALNFQKKSLGKNIAVFHHFDNSVDPFPLFSKWLLSLYVKSLEKVNYLVVVSSYWRDFFISKGIEPEKIKVIYNAFDENIFKSLKEEDIKDFKHRYSLTGRKIIYIGNYSREKGVHDIYRSLSSAFRDYCFIASGKTGAINEGFLILNLAYIDYLALLKASDLVITWSHFNEGWCRTAHEALLLKVPVLGSGKGGMRELLEKSNQIFCPDMVSLPEKAKEAIKRKKELGEKGFQYVSQFTKTKFRDDWQRLLK